MAVDMVYWKNMSISNEIYRSNNIMVGVAYVLRGNSWFGYSNSQVKWFGGFILCSCLLSGYMHVCIIVLLNTDSDTDRYIIRQRVTNLV